MAPMEQQENQPVQPIHWDIPKSRLNPTLIVALVVAVLGLFSGPLLIVLGLGMAGFAWLTTPRQFLIYQNALVIVYGRPRVKVIQFPEIAQQEILSMPMGNRLRVRLDSGRRIMVNVRDVEEFHDRLGEALEKFNETYPRREVPKAEEGPETPTPY